MELTSKLNESTGLIVLRQYGLMGYLRSFKRELTVMESKPADVVFDDLRINEPFPTLLVLSVSKVIMVVGICT